MGVGCYRGTSVSASPPPASRSEGGYNGPVKPKNNWYRWESTGRVEPSARGHRVLGSLRGPTSTWWPGHGCDLVPALHRVGPGSSPKRATPTRRPSPGTVTSWVPASSGGLTPLVTLHHFTHPWWLGEDLWLRA